MSSPRLRRLRLDQERLEARFRDWTPIEIIGQAGIPPEQYLVNYHLKGLFASPDGRILERDQHVAEFNLSLGYPRRAPQCKMVAPIFHPNFDESSICIGDFWAASEGLDDLIVRIGRMIAYQEYNTKSPLNGLAAKWAEENASFLPVDSREISPPLIGGAERVEKKMIIEFAAPDELDDNAAKPCGSIDFGSGAYPLEHDVTTVGRGLDNIICIQSARVASRHAEIYRTAEVFILRDLGSTNGTWIGECMIEEDAFLANGDLVRIGDVVGSFALSQTVV